MGQVPEGPDARAVQVSAEDWEVPDLADSKVRSNEGRSHRIALSSFGSYSYRDPQSLHEPVALSVDGDDVPG